MLLKCTKKAEITSHSYIFSYIFSYILFFVVFMYEKSEILSEYLRKSPTFIEFPAFLLEMNMEYDYESE